MEKPAGSKIVCTNFANLESYDGFSYDKETKMCKLYSSIPIGTTKTSWDGKTYFNAKKQKFWYFISAGHWADNILWNPITSDSINIGPLSNMPTDMEQANHQPLVVTKCKIK